MATLNRVVTQTEAYAEDRRAPSPLKVLRSISGLNISELARLADVNRITVARVENGLVTPTKRTARQLASVLGCPVHLLFPYDDAPAGSRRVGEASDRGALPAR